MRINALNTLYQFPLSDELTSKNSDGIRKGLLAALADDDEQLAVCSNLTNFIIIIDLFYVIQSTLSKTDTIGTGTSI